MALRISEIFLQGYTELFGPYNTHRLPKKGLKEIQIRRIISHVEKCSGGNAEVTCKGSLAFRAKKERCIEAINISRYIIFENFKKTSHKVLHMPLGKPGNIKDIGKDAQYLAKQTQGDKRRKPIRRPNLTDKPFSLFVLDLDEAQTSN